MINLRIETLRGLACILLVLYHVIGADSTQGLEVADGWLRWLNDGLAYLRMPLFTFLSGLVYGMRPFQGDSRAFLLGKARRLLIPMLVVGTVFALLQSAMPGTHSQVESWYLLHLQPVAHFWFVESLFWVFLLVWWLERRQSMTTAGGMVVVLALACGLYMGVRGWSWLGIEGAIYLLPYFLLGLACKRFSWDRCLQSPAGRALLLALALAAIGWIGQPVPNPDRRTLAMLCAGMSLCLLCLLDVRVVGWLAWTGRHSYPIYLFHVFFTAGARIALERLGIEALALHIPLGLALGLLGPVTVDLLASSHPLSALLLLGKSRARTAASAQLLPSR